MGLRINTNLPAVSALRNLKITEGKQARSMQRLSTGLRISTAGDDPSGLVVSNKMRAQVAGMKQAVENTRRDENLVETADAALSEVEEMLNNIRQSVLFAMNAGGADSDQVSVEQDAVDKTLKAIDRIANNTRFGSRQLLNGAAEHKAVGASNEFRSINIEKLQYINETTSQVYTVRVIQVASQAFVSSTSALGIVAQVAGGSGTIRITGGLGSETISVTSTTTAAEIMSAANQVQFNTGVYASANAWFSHGFGSNTEITVEISDSVGTGVQTATGAQTAGRRLNDSGVDIQGTVNGIVAAGLGTTLLTNTTALVAEFNMEHTGAAPALNATNYTFTIRPGSGLRFQLNDSISASSTETIGLRALSTSALGVRAQILPTTVNGNNVTLDGVLSSLAAAGGNSLTANPTNALRIVDGAVQQLSDMRAALGSLAANVFQPNEGALQVAIESLTAAVSEVRDLDFAEETTEFTRSQIMFQAGVSVYSE
jgi:flagellin